MELYTAYVYKDFDAYIDCRVGVEIWNVTNQVDKTVVQDDGTVTIFSDAQIITLERQDIK